MSYVEKKKNQKICLDTHSLNTVWQSKGWSQFVLPSRKGCIPVFRYYSYTRK